MNTFRWNLDIQPVTWQKLTTSAIWTRPTSLGRWPLKTGARPKRTEKSVVGKMFRSALGKARTYRKQQVANTIPTALWPIACNKRVILKYTLVTFAARANAEKRSLSLRHWYITTLLHNWRADLIPLNSKHSASQHASLFTPTIQFTWSSVNISSSKVKKYYCNWNQKWNTHLGHVNLSSLQNAIPVFDMLFNVCNQQLNLAESRVPCLSNIGRLPSG